MTAMCAAALRQYAPRGPECWDAAYDASSTVAVPEDFLEELKKDKNAYAFFKTLNRANTYAIARRLQATCDDAHQASRGPVHNLPRPGGHGLQPRFEGGSQW